MITKLENNIFCILHIYDEKEKHVNQICKYRKMKIKNEIKMACLITWGLGYEQIKFLECSVGEEIHSLVISSFLCPKLSSSTSLSRSYY
jgi:translation initiation factor 2 gamma subunit (eIF-2gamma)